MEGLVARLKALGAAATKLARGLEEYQSLLAEPQKNAFVRETALARLAQAVEGFADITVKEELKVWLATEQNAVAVQKDELRYHFGRSLNAALEGTGMTVKGQLPQLRVGLFGLEVDFAAGKATIFWGPRVERLKTGLSLDPGALVAMLRTWQERLADKAVPPARMIELLHRAYQRQLLLGNLPPGTRVFLTDILAELVMLMQPPAFRVDPVQQKFVEYPRVRFSYDLFRLKESGQFEHAGSVLKLHVANFDATTEKSRAIWVPDNEDGEGTYYSYLSFAGRD